jgi:hypothetical protein
MPKYDPTPEAWRRTHNEVIEFSNRNIFSRKNPQAALAPAAVSNLKKEVLIVGWCLIRSHPITIYFNFRVVA